MSPSRAPLLALILPGAALAHGQPVIVLNADLAAAGGPITVTGREMEPGEVFTITLEGQRSTIRLGQATVAGTGEEGSFTVPADTPPGFYQVRAQSEDGETATAELTVTPVSSQASAAAATIREPTGAAHVLDRSKPVGEVAGVVALIAVSLLGSFVLVRSRA